jgi:hypothetical protein
VSDLDLYLIHNLDRRAPSPDLAAQLTSQLNAAADPVARQRLDTARAVLGDPQRRQAYDAQLADPAAPPITEQTLAALTGRSAPVQAKSSAFARPRVLAALAAFLGVLLIVVVSAVACSGSDDDSDNRTRDAATPGTPSTLTTEQKKSAVVYNAEYRSEDVSFVPGASIRVDARLDLESTARKLGWTGTDFGSKGDTDLTIRRIKSSADLELSWCEPMYAGRKNIQCFVITVSPDLRLLSDAVTSQSELSTRLSKETKVNGAATYLRVPSGGQWPTDAVTVKNGDTKLSAPALVSGANAGTGYFVVPGSFEIYRGTAVWD